MVILNFVREEEEKENVNEYGDRYRYRYRYGEMRVPIGYRFRPTIEELIGHYLWRKVFCLPLNPYVIPDYNDVFHTIPWHLPGTSDSRDKRYYFFRKRNKFNMISPLGRGGCGYWKAIGKEEERIHVVYGSNGVSAVKRSLLFYGGGGRWRSPTPTRWVIHEYRLLPSHIIPCGGCSHEKFVGIEDWVVCILHEKKRKPKFDGVKNLCNSERVDLTFQDKTSITVTNSGPPLSCCSCSTDVFPNESHQEVCSAYVC